MESSPWATATLTDEVVDGILEDVLAHPDVREVGFTGGEPLLRRDRFLELVSRVTAAGRSATCTTNGFWGTSLKAATKTFGALEEAGLSSLTVSYDDYHSPFVKPSRIRNVLDASKLSPISTILNMCVSRTNDSIALLQELGESVLGIQVTRFPVQQCGTGRSIPTADLYLKPLSEIILRCPGFEIIYHHDGRVYPCCSPPIFDTDMTLGRAGSATHEELVGLLERNTLLAVLQKRGLGWFIDKIKEVDPESQVANLESAVSACDVCALVMSDHKNLGLLRDQIRTAALDGTDG